MNLSLHSVQSVRETASPHDDVHPQIPIGREGFLALNLARNPKSLQREGDRVEKRLVHLYPGSVQMRACRVSTWTASQNGHLTTSGSLIPMNRLPLLTKSVAGMTRSEAVGRARSHAVAPATCRLMYRALAKALVSLPPRGSSGPGRAVSGSWFNDACARCACPGRVGSYTTSCTTSMSASGGLGAWSPLTPRPHSRQDLGTMPAIVSFITPHVSHLPQATSEMSDNTRVGEPPPHLLTGQ